MQKHEVHQSILAHFVQYVVFSFKFPLPGDRNGVLQQDYEFRIPKDPEVLEEPECLPMGPIGTANLNSEIEFIYYGENSSADEL